MVVSVPASCVSPAPLPADVQSDDVTVVSVMTSGAACAATGIAAAATVINAASPPRLTRRKMNLRLLNIYVPPGSPNVRGDRRPATAIEHFSTTRIRGGSRDRFVYDLLMIHRRNHRTRET